MALTKKELADKLAEAEAQIASQREDIARFQQEIQVRTNGQVALEQERNELLRALGEVDQSIGQITQHLDVAAAEQARTEEIWEEATGVLDDVVRELYSRLKFVTLTLANVASYKGDNLAVIEQIASAALSDVGEFIEVAEASGEFEEPFVAVLDELFPDAADDPVAILRRAFEPEGFVEISAEDLQEIFGDTEVCDDPGCDLCLDQVGAVG